MNASDFAQEHRADDDKSYPNSIPVERTKRLEKTIFMFEKKTILCLKKKRFYRECFPTLFYHGEDTLPK